MFSQTRVRLTLWFMLVVGLISLFFSTLIYREASYELERGLRLQTYRTQNPNLPFSSAIRSFLQAEDPDIADVLGDIKKRLVFNLIIINFAVVGAAGVAGYFLAGLSLKPIEEMVEEQERFVSDASHELRTPLTGIKTATEVALRDKKLSLRESKEILENNLAEVNSLQLLTDSLLKLAQYEKKGLPFENVLVDKSAAEAIERLALLAKEKKLAVLADLEEVTMVGDKSSLVELIVILLENAIKYSNKGQEITVSVSKSANHSQIKVQDHGVGINEEELPKVFDRFYRSETSRSKSKVVGYGIGLALAKRIVEIHNGDIEVESEVGKGTTFVVELPLKPSVNPFASST